MGNLYWFNTQRLQTRHFLLLATLLVFDHLTKLENHLLFTAPGILSRTLRHLTVGAPLQWRQPQGHPPCWDFDL